MDTDPNPFRDSPDSDRSASSTEAPDDDARDFAVESEEPAATSTTTPSPMSEGSEESSTSASSDSVIAGAAPEGGEPGRGNASPTNPVGENQPM